MRGDSGESLQGIAQLTIAKTKSALRPSWSTSQSLSTSTSIGSRDLVGVTSSHRESEIGSGRSQNES